MGIDMDEAELVARLRAGQDETEREMGIVHRNGISWSDAELPRRWHRCRWQSLRRWEKEIDRCECGKVRTETELFERCACGAARYDRDIWIERNSRRRDERRAKKEQRRSG